MVISVKLGKYIIGNDLVKEHVGNYERFIHYKDYTNLNNCSLVNYELDKPTFGWNQYRKELVELW